MPALVEAANGTDGDARETAGIAVQKFQGVTEADVPVLASLVLNGNAAATGLLLKVGPAARPAIVKVACDEQKRTKIAGSPWRGHSAASARQASIRSLR